MSTYGRPLNAGGQKVLRRAVRLWREMAPDASDYQRGILRGLILALSCLWNIDDSRVTARLRELAEADFTPEPTATVSP